MVSPEAKCWNIMVIFDDLGDLWTNLISESYGNIERYGFRVAKIVIRGQYIWLFCFLVIKASIFSSMFE